jgi:hypothetical protein
MTPFSVGSSYEPLPSKMCCVCEMVRKLHVRLEITSLNPDPAQRMCIFHVKNRVTCDFGCARVWRPFRDFHYQSELKVISLPVAASQKSYVSLVWSASTTLRLALIRSLDGPHLVQNAMEDDSLSAEHLCQSILVIGGSSIYFPSMIPGMEIGIQQYRLTILCMPR